MTGLTSTLHIVFTLQVLKHEPGATVGLKAQRVDGSDLEIELPLDAGTAKAGDAFAVLHAMWCAASLGP